MNTVPIILATADMYLYRYWQAAAVPNSVIQSDLNWGTQSGALVMIDSAMPGIPDWNDDWWKEKTASSRIIYTNTITSDEEAYLALQAGCVGYCHAVAPLETLQQVLTVARNGGIWAGRSLVQRMLSAIKNLPMPSENPLLLAPLSEREKEVAQLAGVGASNKLIARELAITERTVKAHLSSIFEKLQIEDRVQLALWVNGVR